MLRFLQVFISVTGHICLLVLMSKQHYSLLSSRKVWSLKKIVLIFDHTLRNPRERERKAHKGIVLVCLVACDTIPCTTKGYDLNVRYNYSIMDSLQLEWALILRALKLTSNDSGTIMSKMKSVG